MTRLVATDITVVGTAAPAGVPNPPEGFTLTPQADGSPLIDLTWTHDGENLDRFKVSKRPVGGTTWETVIIAPSSDFGVFPNYSYTAVSGENTQWVVQAMNSDGEVSI